MVFIKLKNQYIQLLLRNSKNGSKDFLLNYLEPKNGK